MKSHDELAISQIERRLSAIKKALTHARVKPGWIYFIRHALVMTQVQLAGRAGVSKTTAAQAEQREAKGKVTIETLKKMAAAMECEFIYAFVPKGQIKEILKNQALAKARKLIKNVDTHMALEDQQVKQSMEERIEQLAEKLIAKGDVW